MATQTSKTRDRAVARTLEAAEQMAGSSAGDSDVESVGKKSGKMSAVSSVSSMLSRLVRCPECGKVNKKNCCWYSRAVAAADPAQEPAQ